MPTFYHCNYLIEQLPLFVEKKCSKCNKPFPATTEYFNVGKEWKDKLHPWCKICCNNANKARYEKKCIKNPPHYRWNREMVRHFYFNQVTTPLQAYILGFLAADGNIVGSLPRISLELSIKDIGLLTIIRDELAPGHLIRMRQRKKESTRFTSGESGTLAFTSHEMVADLARFGIVPKKSLIIQWPSVLPEHLASAFILGYFDGDGSITWTVNNGYTYPKWALTSGSHDFLKDLVSIVKKHLGIAIGGPYSKPNSQVYTLSTTGKKAFLLDEWLHENGLGLARKRISS